MRDERQPRVYILASGHYGTPYIGITSNLIARTWHHREEALGGFTQRYHVHLLVHFEMFGDMERAIAREKQLKRWH
jgi:putative endonuclease